MKALLKKSKRGYREYQVRWGNNYDPNKIIMIKAAIVSTAFWIVYIWML